MKDKKDYSYRMRASMSRKTAEKDYTNDEIDSAITTTVADQLTPWPVAGDGDLVSPETETRYVINSTIKCVGINTIYGARDN